MHDDTTRTSTPEEPTEDTAQATLMLEDMRRCARVDGMLAALAHLSTTLTTSETQGDMLKRLVADLCAEVGALAENREKLSGALDARHMQRQKRTLERERQTERIAELSRSLSSCEQQLQRKTVESKANDVKRERAEAALARARSNLQRLHRATRAQRMHVPRKTATAQTPATGRLRGALEKAREVLHTGADVPPATRMRATPNKPDWVVPQTQLLGNERADVMAVSTPSLVVPIGRSHAAYQRVSLPVVAFVVFDRPGDAIEAAIAVMIENFADRPWCTPLFVTDADDFTPFRNEGYAFEFLPALLAAKARAPDLDWELYYARRATMIRNKWQPTSALILGAEPPFDPQLLCLPQDS